MLTGSAADGVYRDSLMDELRTIELAVVEGERQLAEQEALLVDLKKQDRDVSQAELALEMMRETQRQHEHDRQRLLSQLQPKSGFELRSKFLTSRSSGLQTCGVCFRWTRRTCFLRSFGLTFLVPPFSAFRSLPSRCRPMTFGTAADGNSSGICSSVASGSTELMEVTGKRSLFVSVSITGPVPASGMPLLTVTADAWTTALGGGAPNASLYEARPAKPKNRTKPSQTVRITDALHAC